MSLSISTWIKLAALGWATAAALGLYLYTSANKQAQQPLVQAKQTEAPPALPAQPAHRYSVKDGVEYSYERALSASDKIAGNVTSAMISVRFLGERDGRLQVFHKPNAMLIQVFECERSCEYATIYKYVNEAYVGNEKMRVSAGSVIGAIFEDAVAGKLDTHYYQRSGKPMQGFVDREGTMRFYPPPQSAPKG